MNLRNQKGAFHLLLFNSIKEHYQIIIVFLIGLALRLYMAMLDPMLHEWDEKYHALVAKNMIQHPLKPMLYVHQYFATDQYNWTFNHVWLHKQPLFLWQMAFSMKLFGVSELAMRLPSVLMGSLMILMVYRICILATANKLSAVLAGLLLCCSNYYLNLISGREGMDHNDIAFGFYVLASFWAYAEYLYKTSWRWVVLIGLFAGCAILNKWLTGLLVFAPWGLQSLLDWIRTKKLNKIAPITLGLLVCILVFAPWQVYIIYRFPELAQHEYAFNAKHIWEVVEGHGGDIWFYLNKFPQYFGEQVNYLVPIGFVLLFFKKTLREKYLLMLMVAPVLVFCFFSFLVQTKMTGYFYMVAPFCFIFAGVALQSAIDLFRGFRFIPGLIAVGFAVFFSLDIAQINTYSKEVNYRQSKIYNTNIYKQIDKLVPSNINVVINLNTMEHVDAMFYSKRIEAYHCEISEAEFDKFAQQSIPIAAFASREGHVLPDYIARYPLLYIIKANLK